MSLVTALGEILNSPIPPVGIEFLPGDLSAWIPEGSDNKPFLFEERNLGIPHKAVYRAYLEAVHVFSVARKTWSSPPGTDKANLANSSSVILLANPAHQTALNIRKRLVLSDFIDVNVELGFTASLLSLHDGSKQSTLWHHRRWLIRYSRRDLPSTTNGGEDTDTLSAVTLSAEDYHSELSVASRACETYPRNYFAWNHRYTCIRSLVFSIIRSLSNPTSSSLEKVLGEECNWITSWINQHISDYTAMQYACQLSHLLHNTYHNHDSTQPTPPSAEDPIHSFTSQTLRTHAQSLLRSYPDHESLWLYLRNTFQLPETLITECAEDRSVVRGLILFVRDLLNTTSRGSGQDKDILLDTYGTINIHACRFLSWLARQLKVTVGALEGNGRVVGDSVDVGILADSLLRSLS